MPFPPEDFYRVAEALKDRRVPDGEGRYRTIAGRAYYGAYWATCVSACRAHQINPPTNLPHEALSLRLAGTRGDEEVRTLGDLLNGLRLLRVHADYTLTKPLTEDVADDAVVDARKVIEMLPAVEPRLPRIDPAG